MQSVNSYIRVDLPAPLGPNKLIIYPFWNVSETSFN